MKDHTFHVIMIGLLAASLFFLFLHGRGAVPPPPDNRNTISVSGFAEQNVAPDQAKLVVQIETEGKTAQEAQDMNAEVSANVLAAAQRFLPKKQIETIGYSLMKQQSYDPQTGKPLFLGYAHVHTLQLTLDDLDRMGDLLDALPAVGVTHLQGISFLLSKEKERMVREEILQLAVQQAQHKADVLADAFHVRRGKPVMISETNSFFTPSRTSPETLFSAARAPEVLPGDVTVSVSVQAAFVLS